MNDNKSLFNPLTVFAGIVFAVQGVFSHNIYLKIFNCTGLLFLLIALHYEICSLYSNKYIKFITPILFASIVILYIIDPISAFDKSEAQKQIEALQDTLFIRNDSIKTLRYLLALENKSKINSDQKFEFANKYIKVANKPILSVSEYGVDSLLPNKHPVFHFELKNVGNNSAVQIEYYAAVVENSNRTCDTGFYQYNKIANVPSMQPQKAVVAYYPCVISLSQEKYQKIMDKNIFIYYYGVVYYHDAFNKKDSTGFCVIYNNDSPSKFRFNSSHNY